MMISAKWIFLGLTLVLLTLVVQESVGKTTKAKEPEPEEEAEEEPAEEEPAEDAGDGEAEEEAEDEEPEESKKPNPKEPKEEKPKAKGKEKEKEKEKDGFKFTTCQGQKVVTPEPWLKARKTCEQEKLKQEGEEGAKKEASKNTTSVSVCGAVCQWEKMEFLLGSHKKLDQSAVEDFLDLLLTGNLEQGRPTLKKEWKDCKKQIGDEDEDDKKCKRFKKYFTCILTSLDHFCAAPTTPVPALKKPAGLLLNLGR